VHSPKELEDVELRLENEVETKELQAQEKELYWKIYQINRKKEEDWRIKSRILWI